MSTFEGRFREVLRRLRLPLIQAPMAGGITTPALVAAVSRAGALGSFGFALSPPERIADELAQARRLTDAPIGANLFVVAEPPPPEAAVVDAARAAVAPLAAGLGLPAPVLPPPPYLPPFEAQLAAVLHEPPAVVSFHFAPPPADVVERAHRAGVCVGVSATCESEARRIEEAGADFVIAQGWQAGGHRGMFDPQREDERLGTLALVARLARCIRIPVVAAGGLMTGADIAAARAAGAAAAQLGTAFLTAHESGASPVHKRWLLEQPARGTALSRVFTGRPARALRNRLMRDVPEACALPFPLQSALLAGIRKHAVASADGEWQPLWAGAGYERCRNLPAAALIAALLDEWRAAEAAAAAGMPVANSPDSNLRSQQHGRHDR